MRNLIKRMWAPFKIGRLIKQMVKLADKGETYEIDKLLEEFKAWGATDEEIMILTDCAYQYAVAKGINPEHLKHIDMREEDRIYGA
jgi:hypothetical protein